MFLNYYILLPICSQYGVYTTKLDQNNVTGESFCLVLKKNHKVAAIATMHDNKLLEIKSPNKYAETKSYSLFRSGAIHAIDTSCYA